MTHSKILLRTAVLAGLVGLVLPASPAVATPITSSGPLTTIELSTTLACQVSYAGQTTGQFFPGVNGAPGDCGTFLATSGTLFAPDFAAHPGGTATGMVGASTPFTPVSQTTQTGNGTQASPDIVTTVVDAGTTGLRITRIDTYVRGRASYRTDLVVTNRSATVQGAMLYHAFDCYLRGNSAGTGYAVTNVAAQTSRVGCASTKYSEQLTSLTAENRYYEDSFGAVWSRIRNRLVLPNTVVTAPHDNAAAIQWEFAIPPDGSLIRSFLTEFVLPPAQIIIGPL